MRRPLCLACLAFVVTIMLVLIISTPPSGENTITEGEWLQVEGTVYQKEQKEDILYVYIRNIKFFNKQFKSDNSNQNPQTNQIRIPNKRVYNAYYPGNRNQSLEAGYYSKGRLDISQRQPMKENLTSVFIGEYKELMFR